MPSLAQLLLAELDQEMPGRRRALERVPEGQNDWKPHEKSMALGYLAGLVDDARVARVHDQGG